VAGRLSVKRSPPNKAHLKPPNAENFSYSFFKPLRLGVSFFPSWCEISNLESHDRSFQAFIEHILDRFGAKELSNHFSGKLDHRPEWTTKWIRASAPIRPSIQGARQRSNLAIQQLNHLQHSQLRSTFAQGIASAHASLAGENSMVSQRQENLLEEFNRNVTSLRELLNLVNFAGGILSNEK